MKQIEKFLSHTCIYTVFISIAFYIFSNAFNEKGLSMTFGRFLTIFAFSMIVGSMEYIFTFTRIPKFLQYALHYVTLAVAFTVVFFTIRKTSSDFVFTSSTIFASVVLFTFGYAFVFLIMFLMKKLGSKSKKNVESESKSSPTYTPRFK